LPPLKKRNTTNQKYENPENSPFQKPEKSLEVLSHFSLFTEILMLTNSEWFYSQVSVKSREARVIINPPLLIQPASYPFLEFWIF